jgi:exopolyphosphatase/pppGpp-phosphohydrolase
MCVIDMGSNTFKRIVGTFAAGRYEQKPIEKKNLAVGDDVSRNGRISEGKLGEIEQTLMSFKAACERDDAAPIVAVGTAAFRDAANGRAAVDIARKVGIDMEIASEARESELAYLVGAVGRDGYAVIDNGSRSIELAAKDGRDFRHVVFNLGYRIAYESFFAAADTPADAIRAFRDKLLQHASQAQFLKGKRTLVGVEFVEMAEIFFDPGPVEGRVITLQDLQRKLKEVSSQSRSEFAFLKRTNEIDRALPRLVVATTLVEAFGYPGLLLTERELGSGLIIEAGLKLR